jgi:hypothetical protein
MTPFLYKVAKVFYDNHSPALQEFTFVFPNRRAALFFQKYLAEIAGKPIFSPATLTIQELFELLSTYTIADRIELLVTIYEEYKKISKTSETFDDFIYWGKMLIQDFDDVDKFMADSKDVFLNVVNLKSIQDDFSHLTEKQIEELTKFWENLNLKKDNKTKKKFQEAWKILSELYANFKNRLSVSGRVYEGMMFRDVVEKLEQGVIDASKAKRCIFVGFNALTPAEIKLMKFLQINQDADFYWDYESEIFKDKQNRASAWIDKNTKLFPSRYVLSTAEESNATNTTKAKPTVHLFGVPSGIGQVKYLNSILNKIISDEGIKDSKQAINTAVVLPDETLLLPTLYSIPEEITKINVTMGYSLSLSSISSLIHHIGNFQKNLRTLDGEYAFFYRYVKAITNHSLIASLCSRSAEELNRYIIENNRVLLTASEIPDNKILKLIFTPITEWQQVPDYIRNILSSLYSALTGEKKSEEDYSGDTRSNDLEREFIVQYYKTINRLEDLLKGDLEMSVETFFKLLSNMVNGATVSFAGEPLSGLQIMGVLETRVLDFDNIIILSMNEGVFPAKNNINSFIPFSIREAFSLPTYKHQDSIFAYHFYSMISRAKNIYMIYDTRTEMKQTGEVSRYFNQIKYLYPDHYNIIEHPVVFDASLPETETISVSKSSEYVKKKLHSFTIEGEGSSALSASSINNYINCSLRFYFTSIIGLSEGTEVEESVSFAHFGTIFHFVMQNI